MNERIKELERLCRIAEYNEFGDVVEVGFDTEKFAEFLIQECANVCQRIGESGDGYTCSYDILEHFGVEE